MKPAERAAVPPFEVMTVLDKVFALRHAGREVISLCAGEPASGAPERVRRRAAEVVTDGTLLGYSNALGLKELRAAIAGHYRRWYDLEIDPGHVAVTTGASGGFVLGFLSAFDAGDRVALARPGYPAYRNILSAVDLTVVELDCGPAERFQPTLAQLEATQAEAPLAGLIVASPANPTGTMIPPEELAAIARWCVDNDVRLISDEIYHGIVFGDSVGSCAWATDRSGLVVSSFSKFWGMTGWRLGWMLVPDDLLDTVDALAGNLALCPPVPAQHAAIEAFSEEAYAEGGLAVEEYAAARRVVLDRLGDLSWTDVAPADGAFYVYARPVLDGYPDSRAWCAALLDRTGVAVTPGVDFDAVQGDRTVRISLAAGRLAVAEAVERIIAFQRNEPTIS